MPEVRLIDANAAKKALTGWDDNPTDEEIEHTIDELPAINAVPVVHARWVHDDLGHTYCSRCRERLPYIHCYSDESCSDFDEEWDEEIPETRYCPNCGAKMGGQADAD